MTLRKTYINKNTEELKNISSSLQFAFNTYEGKIMKLTAYKESNNYYLLSQAIKKTTGFTLGRSTLRDLITLKHKGQFQPHVFEAIDKFISSYTKSPKSFQGSTTVEPIKQKVFWAVNQGFKAGVFINSFKGEFLEWDLIKKELEEKVITQCPRILPPGCKVSLQDFYGKKDWIIKIIDKENNIKGSVWIGGNPLKNWLLDGFVRIGITRNDTSWEVFQILQRYSDGSYRILKSFV